jgi:SAM-dependent methyltransferase
MRPDDDKAAAAIAALYERFADRYIADRRQLAPYEEQWLDRFIALLPPPRRVLDIGCGAGAPMAEYLLNHNCAVTGIDSSPTLIAHCRKQLRAGSWMVADMRRLALPQDFDGLLAWDSFFHLTQHDQRAMFGGFKQHAAAEAVLMFTSGPCAGVALGSYHGEPLYHASLSPEEYETLLTMHSFTTVAHVARDAASGDRTIWMARHKPDRNPSR